METHAPMVSASFSGRPACRPGYAWNDGYYSSGVWIQGGWRSAPAPAVVHYDSRYDGRYNGRYDNRYAKAAQAERVEDYREAREDHQERHEDSEERREDRHERNEDRGERGSSMSGSGSSSSGSSSSGSGGSSGGHVRADTTSDRHHDYE